MKKAIQHIQWFILILLIIVGWSCNLLTDPDDHGTLGKNIQISDCGGFDAILNSQSESPEGEECRDEQLLWEYTASSNTIKFLHKNLWAGCSSEFSLVIVFNPQEGLYEIQERDTFTGFSLPCLCFYDFQVESPNIEATFIRIRVSLVDGKDQYTRWEGVLDLSNGAGCELILENVGNCLPSLSF
jgi:hypothetical protein